MRVLGIDTSLRSSGYGVVESCGSQFKSITYGIIRNPPSRPLSACLANIHREVSSLIITTQPEAVSIEGIFFCKNARTALILGQARGVVIACCAVAGLPVFEHEPRKVKQSVVGYGAADKIQVARMVMRLLNLPDVPEQEDATDALAIALCQLQSRTGYSALDPEPL